jgi:hypothetical protein
MEIRKEVFMELDPEVTYIAAEGTNDNSSSMGAVSFRLTDIEKLKHMPGMVVTDSKPDRFIPQTEFNRQGRRRIVPDGTHRRFLI